jgi:acyl-coenzyme A thioesterase PaaI-like protein
VSGADHDQLMTDADPHRTVKAHSHPLHTGTRTIVVETEVRGDNGKLAAKLLQTQAIL